MTVGGAGGGGADGSSGGSSLTDGSSVVSSFRSSGASAPAAGAGSFAYGGRSLDELRSLAGSVDTARVADAQTDFTRIASQMDDVVSQLVAIQSRIPSWWHGATADQAVTKFGQVINHAQTAYTIADGASRALSTCATVIAEQQAAMAAVPELSKPRSGLDSGEAFAGSARLAQQSALLAEEQRYEAARGRAVEVVNGMAAQFVETTAQLQTLDSSLSHDTFYMITNARAADQIEPKPVMGHPPSGSPQSGKDTRERRTQMALSHSHRSYQLIQTDRLRSPFSNPSRQRLQKTTSA